MPKRGLQLKQLGVAETRQDTRPPRGSLYNKVDGHGDVEVAEQTATTGRLIGNSPRPKPKRGKWESETRPRFIYTLLAILTLNAVLVWLAWKAWEWLGW